MFDLSLGGPVDEGEYGGPLLRGEPLHEGNCWDSPTGCRKCFNAAASLSDEDLRTIGWSTTKQCDWCKKSAPLKEIYKVRPSDEGCSVEYEVCKACNERLQRDEQEEYDFTFGVCEDDQDSTWCTEHERCMREY